MPTTTTPWREIIRPHADVLGDNFQQAEFAADLTKVVRGQAKPEYQDAAAFFERTVITTGMRRLLVDVLRRLSGGGADPVVQLKTSFGGGKTHTLLAVYHLVCTECDASDLPGVPKLLDEAEVRQLPQGKVVVLDGNELAPSIPRTDGGAERRTLWGELAYRLAGEAGYARVAQADRDGTSPGKAVLQALLTEAGPCVLLLDEVVAYLRQFEPGRTFTGGTYDSNVSFIQALTEAVSAVPHAMLLASLPESDIELGAEGGQRALDSLETYFGRKDAVWEPVDPREAQQIIKRRLFRLDYDEAAADAVCRGFADYYASYKDSFPRECSEEEYYRRLRASYPLHPELLQRLYEDWSTLAKFQRTRGVLRLMAGLISYQWREDVKDPLIMPASFALKDQRVRGELTRYLDGPWEQIILRDVDHEESTATKIDEEQPNLGEIQAARRAARAVFLATAPESSASGERDGARGVERKRVYLGAALPGQSPGKYESALDRLTQKSYNLYQGEERYWYDTRQNLLRTKEDRLRNFQEASKYEPEIRRRLEKDLRASGSIFGGVHCFRESADVPDDEELRLVILHPEHRHATASRTDSPATKAAQEYVLKRGDNSRLNRNRLVFLAADAGAFENFRQSLRDFLAWESIVKDAVPLNLAPHSLQEARSSVETAERRVAGTLHTVFKWLLAPGVHGGYGSLAQGTTWDVVAANLRDGPRVEQLIEKCYDEEMVIPRFAPFMLKQLLGKTYFAEQADGTVPDSVSVQTVWQACCRTVNWPRLEKKQVLGTTIAKGVQGGEAYGYAARGQDGQYEGVVFGQPLSDVYVNEQEVLLQPAVARRLLDAREAAFAKTQEAAATSQSPGGTPPPVGGAVPAGAGNGARATGDVLAPAASPAGTHRPTSFHLGTELSPTTAQKDFHNLYQEVIAHLVKQYGAEVEIHLSVSARLAGGFDEATQRVVTENGNVLGATGEFE